MKGLVTVALIFSLAVNIAAAGTIAYFWVKKPPPPPPVAISDKLEPAPFGTSKLGLSSEQRRQFRELRRPHRNKIKDIRQEARLKRGELLEELSREDPDMERVKALVQEISSIQASLEMEMVQRMVEFKKVLNPEQRERFFRKFNNRMHHKRMGEDGGMRHKHPPDFHGDKF
jgi:Spy/CpxP family protein refolding chaperone